MGVSKTIQGSREGAWLMDAAEHLAGLATKADQAEQELAANLHTDLVSAQDDIQAGRRSGPMLATGPEDILPFTKLRKEAAPNGWQSPITLD